MQTIEIFERNWRELTTSRQEVKVSIIQQAINLSGVNDKEAIEAALFEHNPKIRYSLGSEIAVMLPQKRTQGLFESIKHLYKVNPTNVDNGASISHKKVKVDEIDKPLQEILAGSTEIGQQVKVHRYSRYWWTVEEKGIAKVTLRHPRNNSAYKVRVAKTLFQEVPQ